MEALDGNAIAGTMMAVFGHEMTTETGTCADAEGGAWSRSSPSICVDPA
jgi:Family of unknown function (DUF6510)